MQQAGKQQGIVPLPGSLDVSNSLTHLLGRDVHEDGHVSLVSAGPKRTLVWLQSRNRNRSLQLILLQWADTQATWEALCRLPPLPQSCLAGGRKTLFLFPFMPFLLSPHTISLLLLFFLQVGISK